MFYILLKPGILSPDGAKYEDRRMDFEVIRSINDDNKTTDAQT